MNDSVKIDFKLPKYMLNLMQDTEEYDLANDYGSYVNYADTIDVQSKILYTEGYLSKKQWDTMVRRYQL